MIKKQPIKKKLREKKFNRYKKGEPKGQQLKKKNSVSVIVISIMQ